jgi:hypothetical protein
MQQQRSGKIRTAVERYGISRSTLYELAARYPGLFRKNGRTTLVDFVIGDRIVDSLPHARIGEARKTNAQHAAT